MSDWPGIDVVVDAKGDLLVGTADNKIARKAVGGDGTALFGDSGASDGLSYGLIDHPVPTGWYLTSTFSGIGNQALPSGEIRLCPIRIGKRQTWDRISINVTATTATGNVRLGVYGDTNGKPATLLNDYGTVGVTTTGVKEITISLALAPNVYWLAILSEITAGSVNVSVSNTSALVANFMPRQALATIINGYNLTSVATGSLPSPAGAVVQNSNAPLVGLRAA